MFYLTTCVDIFKFIEGLCASLTCKLLSDLLCAEIAEFFLEIVTRLTTLLLLLIALLANMAVSFISRYLVDVVLKTAFFATNLHYLIVS